MCRNCTSGWIYNDIGQRAAMQSSIATFESYPFKCNPILQFTFLCLFDESNTVTQSNLRDIHHQAGDAWYMLLVLTLPDVTFLVMNVISVVPLGPGPTSHACVSSSSPGLTGDVKRTPNIFNARGSPFATSWMIPRAANPYEDKPCKMTSPKPSALPTRGSGHGP
jgi:hypothetical protein